MSLFHPPAWFPPQLTFLWPIIWVQVLMLRAQIRAAEARKAEKDEASEEDEEDFDEDEEDEDDLEDEQHVPDELLEVTYSTVATSGATVTRR